MAVWKSGPHASQISSDARYLNVSILPSGRSATRTENSLSIVGRQRICLVCSPSINVPGSKTYVASASPIPSILAA